jgi:hypothetical protein
MRHLVGHEAGIVDGLVHGDVIPGGAAAVEAQGAAVQHVRGVELRSAVHLAAEAELPVGVREDDAGARLTQARKHFLRVVADR